MFSTHLTGLTIAIALSLSGCGTSSSKSAVDLTEAEQTILKTNDAMVAAMVQGESTAPFVTDEWRGVNLNGTPMSAEGFEGEERTMEYERIDIIDREVRVYGNSAALRWHANFYVTVNGTPSFAEMRLLDVYVNKDGKWLNDLTQVTPIFGTVGNRPEQ